MEANTLIEALLRAIQNGDIVKIRYSGGRQPGAIREIVPRGVKDGLLHAVCIASDSLKSFSISKIELIDPLSPLQANFAGDAPSPVYTSIEEILKNQRSRLESLGWIVLSTDTDIGLHRCRKNGTPLKSPDVSLQWNQEAQLRPWYVSSKGLPASRSFKYLGEAASFFLERAQCAAPSKAMVA